MIDFRFESPCIVTALEFYLFPRPFSLSQRDFTLVS